MNSFVRGCGSTMDSIPENLTPAVDSGHVPETEMSAWLPSWKAYIKAKKDAF